MTSDAEEFQFCFKGLTFTEIQSHLNHYTKIN